MDRRKFNAIFPRLNHRWSSQVLNIPENPRKGPDLKSDKIAIELKFTRNPTNAYVHKSWRVLEYQIDYNKNGTPTFWGLGFYTLSKRIADLKPEDIRLLERSVTQRELYIIEWDWMNQFTSYHQSGKTERSKWDQNIRFPKFKLIPETTHTFKVRKGLVHLTEGVSKELFGNIETI